MRRRFYTSSEPSFLPMTVEALENGLSYAFGVDSLYKVDNGEWNILPANETSVSISAASKIYITAESIPNGENGVGSFRFNKKCNIGGDIRSLFYNGEIKENACIQMFYNTPVVNIEDGFLSFKKLYLGCFERMFASCKELVKAPVLETKELAARCYVNMFSNCPNLRYIKMLATDISAYDCLHKWVDGVSSTGTFVKHPNMTSLPRGVNGIPEGWTVINA